MYAAELLTTLKVNLDDVKEEKGVILCSLLQITTLIKNNFNYNFVDDAISSISDCFKSIFDEINFEQTIYEKLIEYFEKDNVSRLDNTSLLDDIDNLLNYFESNYEARTMYFVELEHYYFNLIQYKGLTSNNYELELFESPISSEDKEKVIEEVSKLK